MSSFFKGTLCWWFSREANRTNAFIDSMHMLFGGFYFFAGGRGVTSQAASGVGQWKKPASPTWCVRETPSDSPPPKPGTVITRKIK